MQQRADNGSFSQPYLACHNAGNLERVINIRLTCTPAHGKVSLRSHNKSLAHLVILLHSLIGTPGTHQCPVALYNFLFLLLQINSIHISGILPALVVKNTKKTDHEYSWFRLHRIVYFLQFHQNLLLMHQNITKNITNITGLTYLKSHSTR